MTPSPHGVTRRTFEPVHGGSRRVAGALPDTGGAQGPWLVPVEKGTLVAWVSSTNELRRAVVTCRD